MPLDQAAVNWMHEYVCGNCLVRVFNPSRWFLRNRWLINHNAEYENAPWEARTPDLEVNSLTL